MGEELKTNWHRYLIGTLVGLVIFLIYLLCKSNSGVNGTCDAKVCNHYNQVKHDSLHHMIKVFEDGTKKVVEFEEKINSTNKRLDDYYIWAGIIVTLLIGINLSVFVNADKQIYKEVRAHMKDNFESYKKEIEDNLKKSQVILGELRVEYEVYKKDKESKDSSDVTGG